MMEDYYDLDAILAEDEKVKVVICEYVHDLGWLTGGKSGSLLHANTTMELPFYLARELVRGGGVDVDLMTPEIFNARVRKALRADANHLELPLLSPHFYCFGIQYLDLAHDPGLEIILKSSFKERLTTTMDIAQFGDLLEQTQLSNKLDETEKKMFQAGILSSEFLREWNRNSLGRIRSASEIDKKRNNGH